MTVGLEVKTIVGFVDGVEELLTVGFGLGTSFSQTFQTVLLFLFSSSRQQKLVMNKYFTSFRPVFEAQTESSVEPSFGSPF